MIFEHRLEHSISYTLIKDLTIFDGILIEIRTSENHSFPQKKCEKT